MCRVKAELPVLWVFCCAALIASKPFLLKTDGRAYIIFNTGFSTKAANGYSAKLTPYTVLNVYIIVRQRSRVSDRDGRMKTPLAAGTFSFVSWAGIAFLLMEYPDGTFSLLTKRKAERHCRYDSLEVRDGVVYVCRQGKWE